MLHAAWKSLLGRKLRLFMSTFAIVLGVAFVAGTLIFTDTLNKSFVAIFDSSVGDVVVRPVGAADNEANPTTLSIPADVVASAWPRCRRGARRRQRGHLRASS